MGPASFERANRDLSNAAGLVIWGGYHHKLQALEVGTLEMINVFNLSCYFGIELEIINALNLNRKIQLK